MRFIVCSKGQKVKVSDADYAYLNQWTWYVSLGYARRSVWDPAKQKNGKPIYMHREVKGAKPGDEVDHIDRDKLNNQRSNLRLVKRGYNNQNKQSKAKSGFKGVQANRQRWQALLTHKGKRYSLGTFDDPADAAHAYDRAALKYYGPKAFTNFPIHAVEV